MANAGDLIDRVFRNYLEPPDEQPSWAPIETAGGINATDTTVTYRDGFLDVAEESAITPGITFEIGRELFRASTTPGSRVLNFTPVANYRGIFGTTAAIHAIDTPIKFSPTFSRQRVFDAVGDAVEGLWPALYGVGNHLCDTSPTIYGIPSTTLGIELFRWNNDGRWEDATGQAELLTNHSFGPDSMVVQTYNLPSGRTAELVYRYQIARPTDETTAITGLKTDWEPLVVLGAVMAVMTAEPTISASVQSFVTDSLAAQGFPPGESESLVGALTRLYGYRENRAVQGWQRKTVSADRIVNTGVY